LILIAGSTWNEEEALFLPLFHKSYSKRVQIILAPRRLERVPAVARLLEGSGRSWTYWSQVKGKGRWDTDLLLVDTLGDLKDLYQAAHIAFIGGSVYPKGGQNPLEPASARLPILFGPSMSNFSDEAHELRHNGAGRESSTTKDLLRDIEDLLLDENERIVMGEAAAKWVLSKQGAVKRTVNGIKKQLGI
jgi:3-deoxy-D-manno-octulosonic-acid transferase